jgi:Zn-dependent protease with chaperone function
MPFLLMVFLTLVCLPDGEDWPTPRGVPSATASAGLTAACVVAVVASAWFLAWRARRALERSLSGREVVLARYERGRLVHRLLVLGVYAGSLFLLGWGRAAYWLWGAGIGAPWPETGESPWSGAELILLAPFLASLLLSWACFYDADRAAYQSAHRIIGIDLASHEWLEKHASPLAPPVPFGSRLAYILFQLRQTLALVFIPLSLLLALKEVRRHLHDSMANWEIGINAVGFAVVCIGMPWLVRLALGLRPLPAGPLRQRLLATARRLRFRFSDVMLWHTRGGMANAMVVGLLPWPRYILLTDRMVEDFSDDEVEAVFGHEVGHVKHRHIPFYLLFLSLSLAALWLGGERLALPLRQLPALSQWLNPPREQAHEFVRLLPLAGIMLAYVFLVFGFLSRRCERQADVYGCRAVSCLRDQCPGHGRDESLPEVARGLCSTGIRTFVRALEKVALVNGISRDRPGFLQSWQHGTIARRVDFLLRVLADPLEEGRFQRRVAAVKWGLLALLGAVLLLAFPGAEQTASREKGLTKPAPKLSQEAPAGDPTPRSGSAP